jgi:hypothetical protein
MLFSLTKKSIRGTNRRIKKEKGESGKRGPATDCRYSLFVVVVVKKAWMGVSSSLNEHTVFCLL